MIHIQVKAKSGLHAGAMWRLDNSMVTLGANSQSDVFLCDPEIPDTLISLRKNGRRFTIDSLHSEAKLTSPDQKKVDNTIFPSEVLTLDFKHIQIELQIVNSTSGLINSFKDSCAKSTHNIIQLLRGIGARAIVAILFVIGLLLTTMILFFGTAGVTKSEASVIQNAALYGETSKSQKSVADLDSRMAENVGNELNAFAEKISTNQMTIDVEETTVNVDAELSRAQAAHFEKLLSRLARDYGDKVQISATLQLTSEQLQIDQIDIEQVVLGRVSVVVLRDGARLYVGGKYNGVSLVSIDSRKVVFEGNAIYEVML